LPNQDREYLNYYDGSAHIEFSEEIAEGLEAKQNEQLDNNEEWRRFIGANPFGM
jgi:hypothetical protein